MDAITSKTTITSAALAAMEAALGSEHVLTTREAMADHGDPMGPQTDWYRPGAVLMPGSVEEVQAVLRIANEHGTPIWTSSQGRNKGYGGGAPRVSESFTMSLRRMNRVLEVDEENCMALVEPGVRFFDLYDHLKATGSKLWMSVPDLGGRLDHRQRARTRRGLYPAGRSLGPALRHGSGAARWRDPAHRHGRDAQSDQLAGLSAFGRAELGRDFHPVQFRHCHQDGRGADARARSLLPRLVHARQRGALWRFPRSAAPADDRRHDLQPADDHQRGLRRQRV